MISFDCNDVTITGDGTRIYGVWAGGKAPLNRRVGRDNAGVYVGRVWQQGGYGWVAAPRNNSGEADSWSAEVQRSVRHFRTRKEACVFLWGHQLGVGSVKFAEAMAAMPRPIGTHNS